MRETLGSLFYRVGVRQRVEMTAALQPFELTLGEYVCLRLLNQSPGSSNAELARALQVTPQTMNTTLNRLQTNGLVQRPESVDSGRARPATLSAKGSRLLDQVADAVQAAEDRVLVHLSATERRELRRLLAAAAR
jgi:DNA-binding MarR family transcriptional regulator